MIVVAGCMLLASPTVDTVDWGLRLGATVEAHCAMYATDQSAREEDGRDEAGIAILARKTSRSFSVGGVVGCLSRKGSQLEDGSFPGWSSPGAGKFPPVPSPGAPAGFCLTFFRTLTSKKEAGSV